MLTAEDAVELVAARRYLRAGRARQARLRSGLTLREVAEAVGVSTPAVFRWEVGDRSPRSAAALRYVRFLRRLEVR